MQANLSAGLTFLRRLWSSNYFRAGLAAVVCLAGVYVYAGAVEAKYPISDWLFWKVLPIWAACAGLVIACLSFGQLLLRRVLRLAWLPPLESGLWAMTLGSCSFVIALYAFGAVGGFKPGPMLMLPIAFATAGARELWAWLREPRATANDHSPSGVMRPIWFAATGLGALCIGLLYLQTFTPTSINFDASWYHLPIGQDYAREHRIVPFPGDVNRAFPHFASMLYAWGFSLPGMLPDQHWMLALHIEFVFVLWKIVGAAAAARYLLSGQVVPGLWAAFFLFPSLFVYDQNPGGSSDHFLGFFAAPVLLGALRTGERFDPRSSAILGVALGGAMLAKYQAVYLIGAAAAVLLPRVLYLIGRELYRRRQGRPVRLGARRVARALLLGAALAGAVAAPHFVKNSIFYHNPVYPMAQRVFTGSRPQHEKTLLFFEKAYPTKAHLPEGEGLERQRIALENFFTFSFEPHYSFTKRYPSMGSLFTLLLPCLLLIRRPLRPALAAFAAFAGVWVWSNTYTSDRYLQAIVPIFVATTAALLVRTWQLGVIARLGLVPLVLFQLVWSGDVPFYSGKRRIESAIDLISSGYDGKRSDAQRFKYRRDHKAITKATPADAVLLARNYRTTLGIDRAVIFDIQAWQSQIFYEPIRGPRELYELYRSAGVTHLLYPKNQRVPDTVQAAVLFNALAALAPEQKRFGSLVLARLPNEAPPPDELPFHVLVAGVRGYRDGLYRVEQLSTHNRIPAPRGKEPRPEQPLDSDAIEDLLDRAQALVLGRGKSSLKNRASDFREAERFKEYTVLLRRGASSPEPDEPTEPVPSAPDAAEAPEAPEQPDL